MGNKLEIQKQMKKQKNERECVLLVYLEVFEILDK